MKTETTNTRELTHKELNFMRRKHFVIVPVLLIAALFLWVVTVFESLPEFARLAGGAIAILAVLIFIVKHVKMEIDIRGGLVHVIEGEITKRTKFGGRRKKTSGGVASHRGSKRRGAPTYFIFIDHVKFNVPAKIYSKVKQGDRVEMNYFPKSQFHLGIRVVGG